LNILVIYDQHKGGGAGMQTQSKDSNQFIFVSDMKNYTSNFGDLDEDYQFVEFTDSSGELDRYPPPTPPPRV
jgi:hypothetical protein